MSDPLTPDGRKIFDFMVANAHMSPREVADHLGVDPAHIFDILARDLRWVMSET